MRKAMTRRTALVAGCLCFGSAIGLIVNSISIFFPAIATDLALSTAEATFISTVLNGATAVGAPLAAHLMEKHHRLGSMMAIGVILAAASLVIIACTPSVLAIYVASAAAGLSIAFFSTIPVTSLIRSWYGERSGAALGFAMSCSGLLGALANPLFSLFVGLWGWRISLGLDGLLVLLLALPAALLVVPGPELAEARPQDKGRHRPSILVPAFWLLALFILLTTWAGALIDNLSLYGTDCGLTLGATSAMLSASMVANILSKIAAGALSDHKGPFVSAALCCLLSAAGEVLLLAGAGSALLLVAGSFLLGFSIPAYTVLVALLVDKCLEEGRAQAYALLTALLEVAFALFITFEGSVRDVAGSYMPVLAAGIVLAFAATALVLALGKMARRRH